MKSQANTRGVSKSALPSNRKAQAFLRETNFADGCTNRPATNDSATLEASREHVRQARNTSCAQNKPLASDPAIPRQIEFDPAVPAKAERVSMTIAKKSRSRFDGRFLVRHRCRPAPDDEQEGVESRPGDAIQLRQRGKSNWGSSIGHSTSRGEPTPRNAASPTVEQIPQRATPYRTEICFPRTNTSCIGDFAQSPEASGKYRLDGPQPAGQLPRSAGATAPNRNSKRPKTACPVASNNSLPQEQRLLTYAGRFCRCWMCVDRLFAARRTQS